MSTTEEAIQALVAQGYTVTAPVEEPVSETALVRELRELRTMVITVEHGRLVEVSDYTRDRLGRALLKAADELAAVHAAHAKMTATFFEVDGDIEWRGAGSFLELLDEAIGATE